MIMRLSVNAFLTKKLARFCENIFVFILEKTKRVFFVGKKIKRLLMHKKIISLDINFACIFVLLSFESFVARTKCKYWLQTLYYSKGLLVEDSQ